MTHEGESGEAWQLAIDHAYAQWAPFYPPRAHNPLMDVEERAMSELMPTIAGRVALDVGCGTGRYLERLVRQRAAMAIGVDRSAAMLGRVETHDATLIRADARRLPLRTASIDLVICGLVLMDVAELDMAIAEMARVLAPRGVLVYSTINPLGEGEGWTRSFETPDGRHTLPTCWHALDRHLASCRAAGLVVDARREPVLAEGAPSGRRPVALIVRATKVS